MKSALPLFSGVLAAALLAGCSADGGDDGAEPETSEQPAAAAESTEPTIRTEAALAEFTAPSGYSQSSEEGVSFALEYDHVGASYQLENGTAYEQIFVTSYLLPEDADTASFDGRAAFVAEYDAVTGNETSSSGTRAIASGYPAVFRYLKVDYDGESAQQRNFFVFDGNAMTQITCQWKDPELEDAITKGCQEVQENLNLPA
ncbi:hypothetical protein [Glycomyces buryatensis]|uniref:Lipoprotein n=1 Tax=Glycomyces buryatensis TaxID=2570927 RepID=A0A4S8QGF8_9ACTN|nr:hypothetical protein [Glycomyces buryatensis]THV43470.1 hypothetical protein FAB82_01005 [Glycomyces buryatensis]